ncbi:DUF4019 domain-containing protein [Ramlibacter sp. PS3R-8]|uniref:DUF4019 domain-containing protein n=1 Tax=Ramlibacter sp. PS3R-8 TaxID=3133437 RepID=UPI00309BDA2C
MKPSFRLAALTAALCVAAAAQAQLKPPATGLPARTAPAAPAPSPAATPVAPAPTAPGAISNPEAEKAGQLAAHAWLVLLDRRDWGSAWDASSAVFRQTVPLGTWMDGIPKVREPFGAMLERQPGQALYKKTLAGRPDGDYVTVHFVSRFDKNPEVVETVTTVREADGRWRVTGYTAR